MFGCFKADSTFLLVKVRESKVWGQFHRAKAKAERFRCIYGLCQYASMRQAQLTYCLQDHFDSRGPLLCSEVFVREDLQCQRVDLDASNFDPFK